MYKYISTVELTRMFENAVHSSRARKSLRVRVVLIKKRLYKQIHKEGTYCSKNRIKIISAVKTVIAKHTILFLALF